MTIEPIEETLSMTAHSQMSNEFASVRSIATSGHEESEVGFDIGVSSAKQLYLQYKRPRTLTDGLKFHIDDNQRKDLVDFYHDLGVETPTVFYAFPRVKHHEQLDEVLSRVLFVDVTAIEKNTTLVYVPDADPTTKPGGPLDAYVNGKRVSGSIGKGAVWCWRSFKNKLIECVLGTPTDTWRSNEIRDDRPRYRGSVETGRAGSKTMVVGSEKFSF